MWNLFLDDQWNDPHTTERVRCPSDYTPAASSDEAIALVEKHGIPHHMMLDFDLGGDDKASKFLWWLASTHPNGPVPGYTVHSKNGPGSFWIKSFLDSWKRSLELD